MEDPRHCREHDFGSRRPPLGPGATGGDGARRRASGGPPGGTRYRGVPGGPRTPSDGRISAPEPPGATGLVFRPQGGPLGSPPPGGPPRGSAGGPRTPWGSPKKKNPKIKGEARGIASGGPRGSADPLPTRDSVSPPGGPPRSSTPNGGQNGDEKFSSELVDLLFSPRFQGSPGVPGQPTDPGLGEPARGSPELAHAERGPKRSRKIFLDLLFSPRFQGSPGVPGHHTDPGLGEPAPGSPGAAHAERGPKRRIRHFPSTSSRFVATRHAPRTPAHAPFGPRPPSGHRRVPLAAAHPPTPGGPQPRVAPANGSPRRPARGTGTAARDRRRGAPRPRGPLLGLAPPPPGLPAPPGSTTAHPAHLSNPRTHP